MKRFIVTFWDACVYRLAYYSLCRMALRDNGSVVVIQLWLNRYLQLHPVSEEQKTRAEVYFEQHLQNKIR